MRPWLRTAIALLIGVSAASTAAQHVTKITPASSAPAPEGSDDGQGGIKLHGDWVLDVRNPDGTLAAHSEFKNSLTPSGQEVLAGLLAGRPFYDLFVTFNQGRVTDAFGDIVEPLCTGGTGPCYVYQPGTPSRLFISNTRLGRDAFQTLSRSAVDGRVVLTGTFTITLEGNWQIRRAVTHLVTTEGTDRVFTLAILPAPVPVVLGQIVQFTYTLSFS